MSRRANCKWCGSDDTTKVGKTEAGRQRYVCNDCGRYTTSKYISSDYSVGYDENEGKSTIGKGLVILGFFIIILGNPTIGILLILGGLFLLKS